MQVQDTPRPPKTEYRGSDWTRIQAKYGRRADSRTSGPAAAAAPPRLGSSAHFADYRTGIRDYAGPSYLATMKGYGANGGKLVLRTVHEQPRVWSMNEPKPRRHVKGTPRTEADPVNVRKSAARARAEIEDWVRMMCTPDVDYRLVTLTKRNGMLTYEECWDAVAAMRRQVDKHYPGVSFLAVPERHLGDGDNHGTYHVHCIMVFPPGVKPVYKVFHRLWKKALGGTGNETGPAAPGNVDFANTHAGDGTRYTACQAARYLAKYVTKDVFGGNVGGKRYTTTHGAPTPPKRYWWEPIDANHARTRSRMVQCLRQFYPATDYQILSQTFHDGGDTYHVFSAEPVPKLTG